MISLEDRPIVHEFIVLELAIRSLQQDYIKLETLKMHKFYVSWAESVLKRLYQMYTMQKGELASKRIQIVRWTKVDAHFSDVVVATAGEDIVLRYANNALKVEVEQMLIGRFIASIE